RGRRAASRAMLSPRVSAGLRTLRWLPRYGAQRLLRAARNARAEHVIIAVADHFEPSFLPSAPGRYADYDEQERRVERWCRTYPRVLDAFRDAEGFPWRHTYFYPAEQEGKTLIDRLAAHCDAGWGEIEVHLHHGVHAPATAEETRRALTD